MIAKGNLHAHGRTLAKYLLASKDGEHAELMELRGFAADNLRDAFLDVQIQAEATRATKPFFHAYVRLPAGEELTREQWHEIADRIEQRLGFEGQPRAVAVHHKEADGVHIHVAWSRIDLETMKAIDPGLYKNKLKELCRELEKEYGLTEVRNERDPADKTKSAARDEFEQARRLGTDLKAIRADIRESWDSADSGKAFAAALDERGLVLARGDRRDFVVVDHAGGEHALGKRITGATAAETRARLADLDRAALPSVDEAKEQQAVRARARAERDAEPGPAPQPEREQPAEPPPTPPRQEVIERPPTEPVVFQPEPPAPEPSPPPELRAVNEPNLPPTYSVDPALTGGDSFISVGLDLFAITVHESIAIGHALAREGVSIVHELKGGVPLQKFAADELARRGNELEPRAFSPAEFVRNPDVRREHYAHQEAERERDAALGRMGADLKSGSKVQATDMQKLNRDDLENIRAKGDAHLRDMIRAREEREAKRGQERERERER